MIRICVYFIFSVYIIFNILFLVASGLAKVLQVLDMVFVRSGNLQTAFTR